MKKLTKSEAQAVLCQANEKPLFKDDDIGRAIDTILRSPHKTYRYILITAILAKSTNATIDILSLQARDDSEGAYDARSLCHNVVVPFERKVYPNSLGGSNEPFLNKPARFTRLSKNNAVRRGQDLSTLSNLIDTLSRIQTKDQAQLYLSSALYTMSEISKEIENKYKLPRLRAKSRGCQPQTIMDFVCKLIKRSCDGEICPLIVSTIEHIYYGDKRLIVPHNVNESGASSKEVGDIDIFDSKEQLISSIEVKDKDFTKEDVEHAITKFAHSKLERSLFVFGRNIHFEKHEVYKTAAMLGNQGYFCSIISIEDFVRMRLYSLKRHVSLRRFVDLLLYYAKGINAKDSTVEWIKKCATDFD